MEYISIILEGDFNIKLLSENHLVDIPLTKRSPRTIASTIIHYLRYSFLITLAKLHIMTRFLYQRSLPNIVVEIGLPWNIFDVFSSCLCSSFWYYWIMVWCCWLMVLMLSSSFLYNWLVDWCCWLMVWCCPRSFQDLWSLLWFLIEWLTSYNFSLNEALNRGAPLLLRTVAERLHYILCIYICLWLYKTDYMWLKPAA